MNTFFAPATALDIVLQKASGGGAPTSAPPVLVAYQDFEPDATEYEITGLNFGTPSANRYALVVWDSLSTGATATSSVEVLGVTQTTFEVTSASGNRDITIAVVPIPTGTTGSAKVVRSGTTNRGGMEVSVFYSTQSARSARTGAAPTSSASASSITLGSVTVPTGGWGYAATWIGGTGAVTWSQTSGSGTKVTDDSVGTSGLQMSTLLTTTAGAQAFTADGADTVQYLAAAITWDD